MELVERLLDRAARDGVEMALCFSDMSRAYQPAGFDVVPMTDVELSVVELSRHDVGFVQYAITNKQLLAGLGTARARQLHVFIAEEGITAAAYVVVSIVGGTWTIEECGDRNPSGARAVRFCRR